MKPDLKIVQHDTSGPNGDRATTSTPYSYWVVYIGSVKIKTFTPYDGYWSHITDQEENKRKMLKFVRDLEEELCVTAIWTKSVKKVIETAVEEPIDAPTMR